MSIIANIQCVFPMHVNLYWNTYSRLVLNLSQISPGAVESQSYIPIHIQVLNQILDPGVWLSDTEAPRYTAVHVSHHYFYIRHIIIVLCAQTSNSTTVPLIICVWQKHVQKKSILYSINVNHLLSQTGCTLVILIVAIWQV